MTRVVSFVTAGVLILIQTAGITSMPGVFAHMPLTLAVSAYLLNYRHVRRAWSWILAQGLVFELFHLGNGWPGLELLAHTSAVLACILLSRSVFTNRSFYGLAACAAVSVFVLELVRLIGNELAHRTIEPLSVLLFVPCLSVGLVGCLFAASRLVSLPPSRERL